VIIFTPSWFESSHQKKIMLGRRALKNHFSTYIFIDKSESEKERERENLIHLRKEKKFSHEIDIFEK
jgi:hypothetical protein